MVRQCAWCLRLMDGGGMRISSIPVPKIYAASHGMCQVCGALWLEEALAADGDARLPLSLIGGACSSPKGSDRARSMAQHHAT